MALYPRLPHPSYPSGRYTRTNPLRREFGLRLLTESLPDPLRTNLIRAWRRPAHFDGKEAIQNLYRQRPAEASLSIINPRLLGFITLAELEVSRRIVEAPAISISRETHNRLLASQGQYLQALYAALSVQLGSAEAALAQFLYLLNAST
jgi:hypothetical protein